MRKLLFIVASAAALAAHAAAELAETLELAYRLSVRRTSCLLSVPNGCNEIFM